MWVGLGLRWVRKVGAVRAPDDRTGAVIRSGGFWWLMAARPIERNFIPHSTTLARGWMTGNRLGAGLGVVLAAFVFGEKASGPSVSA